ncbi:MAG: hypothetical protein KIT14_01705 [bacterium]|nr:hypothetical protein [bacterium]
MSGRDQRDPPARYRIGPDAWATITFEGPVDQRAVRRLIRHLEADLDRYPEDPSGGDHE